MWLPIAHAVFQKHKASVFAKAMVIFVIYLLFLFHREACDFVIFLYVTSLLSLDSELYLDVKQQRIIGANESLTVRKTFEV